MDTAGSEFNERLDVAAEHATLRVPTAGPRGARRRRARRAAGQTFDCADDVAVLDGPRLVGVVPIERLLGGRRRRADRGRHGCRSPGRRARRRPGGGRLEHGATAASRASRSSTPTARFAGLVPPHRMLAVLLAEHDEDLARLGGYLAGPARARRAAEEQVAPPPLAPAAVAADRAGRRDGVGADRRRLRGAARQASPAGVLRPGRRLHGGRGRNADRDAADPGPVGRVSVRADRAARAHHRRVDRPRDRGGVLPFALVVWGDARRPSRSRSRSWRAARSRPSSRWRCRGCSSALGTDPAFGSGPLATVVQDLLSIAVYFAIATPLAA